MANFNKFSIAGNLVYDIELKLTNSGLPIIHNSVAVKRIGSDTTDFVPVTFWKKTAEFVKSHFAKGDNIIVFGRMENHQYKNKEGKTVDDWQLTADSVDFGSARKSSSIPPKECESVQTPYMDNSTEMIQLNEDEDLPF